MDNRISRRKFLKLSGGLAVAISVGGCINPEFNPKNTVPIQDQEGNEILVPENPEKIVAVGSGALRLISYMKAADTVVGVEEFEINDGRKPYIMANPQLQEKPSIGPQHGGDAEKIAGVNPDVIFASEEYDGDTEVLSNKTGIPVIELKYGEIMEPERETFYSALKVIGSVLGKEKRAEEIENIIEDHINDLKERISGISEQPRIYVGGIGQRGEQGLTSTITDYPSLEIIGLENMDGKLRNSVVGEHTNVDRENLIEYDPEIIFIDGSGLSLAKEDLKREEYRKMSAVENNQIYSLFPYNYYNTQFENVIINSYLLGKHLKPGSFSDIEPEEKANKIYRDFLGEPVFQEMESEFGSITRIDI
ncbi:ABC transporter substrate-binding protein [Methanonatronarchaeum sp. AMET6-2]|uniref:ABC transporter substrate-binding protein n=1 Tax=Methanonatronarchaeum sp. AMET6-2 TaxID=2933293 RepID=UPI00120342E6|nr:ABC transporter substrate-binding protein [Methanonatronarchaeum sp. AMET6-2]RZN60299.1 MAG: iron ABC transporter substrate-binding protein [Methanonatronarchaeia archaeon]UOY10544.1 ABC transporter substrate-binding protein [Methanonatronarchaeum sp. AMET6-2]